MNRLNKLRGSKLLPIALTYLVLSILWIIYSDHVVLLYFDDPKIITTIQTYKGLFYISVSVLLVIVIMQTNNYKLNRLNETLRVSKLEFEATFEQAAVGIVHHMPNENLIRVNKKICDILGYEKNELLKMKFEDFISPDELERGRDLDQELINGMRNMYITEKDYLKNDGSSVTLKLTKSITHNGTDTPVFLIAIIEDVTKQKQAEKTIKESLEEKNIMLSEIHHRVLNNLTVVSSIIELQVFEENNPVLNEKLMECTLRIKTIAEIHEQLYRSESFSKLDYHKVLKKIIPGIIESKALKNKIQLLYQCTPVQISINQAIPCSLIVNEVVGKILKNNSDETGFSKMIITLDENEDNMISLIIRKEIQGSVDDIISSNNESLRENLINGLSHQLRGQNQFKFEDGEIIYSLRFRKSDVKGIAGNNIF